MAVIVANKPFVVNLAAASSVAVVVVLVTSFATMVVEYRSSEDMEFIARVLPLVANFPSFLDIYY